jgi:RNA-directed DNA polymerase
VGKSGLEEKSFQIPKQLVWEAYRRVKANKGAAGVDGQSMDDFEEDLKNNLYRIWNRMSSGTYFPPAVKAVEIPEPHGGGTRILGVPTVADRIAQTVVAMRLETRTELIFHPDSYGYRPRKSAHDALKKVPRTVLEEGLGAGSRYPEVLRFPGSRSRHQDGGGEHH